MAHVKQRHIGVIAGVLVPLLAGTPLHAAPTAPATSATRTVFSDANHVGHVVLERDETGAIVGTPHRYSPYGVVLGEDPVPQEAPRFGGKLRDAASNLDDVHARHYQSDYARFLSADPAQDGSHHYAFGNNNPLKYMDPSGAIAVSTVVALGFFAWELRQADSWCGDALNRLGQAYGAGQYATDNAAWGGLQAVACAAATFLPAKVASKAGQGLRRLRGRGRLRMAADDFDPDDLREVQKLFDDSVRARWRRFDRSKKSQKGGEIALRILLPSGYHRMYIGTGTLGLDGTFAYVPGVRIEIARRSLDQLIRSAIAHNAKRPVIYGFVRRSSKNPFQLRSYIGDFTLDDLVHVKANSKNYLGAFMLRVNPQTGRVTFLGSSHAWNRHAGRFERIVRDATLLIE